MTSVPLSKDSLQLDCAKAVDEITRVIRQAVTAFRRRGLVVALSGGIDSSVTAALCVKAVGPERVFGIHMPDKESAAETLDLSQSVSNKFGFASVIEEITPQLEAARCYERQEQAIR